MSLNTIDSDHCSIAETAENRNDDPSTESIQPKYSLQRWSEEVPRESIWSSFNLRTRVVRVKIVKESLEEWRKKYPAPDSMVMSFESALLSQLEKWHDMSMQLFPSVIFWLTGDTRASTESPMNFAQKPSSLSEGCLTVAVFEDSLLHQNEQTYGPTIWQPKSPSVSEGSMPSWTVGSTESSENCTTTSDSEGNPFPQIAEDISTKAYAKLDEKPWKSFEANLKADEIVSQLNLDSIMSWTGQQLHLCVFTTIIDPVIEMPPVERPRTPGSSSTVIPRTQPNFSNFLEEPHALVKRKPSPLAESGATSNSIKRLKVSSDPAGEDGSINAFGCPFCKANPSRYLHVHNSCAFPPGFNIKRLTEHLKRNHSSKHCCKNCRKRFFGAAEKAQKELCEHINRGDCKTKKELVTESEWMSENQEEVFNLNILKRSRATEEEKWKAIYRFLFPKHSFVPSPYYNYYVVNQENFDTHNPRNQGSPSQSHHFQDKHVPNTYLRSPLGANTPSTSSSCQDATVWCMAQSPGDSQEPSETRYTQSQNSFTPVNPAGGSEITLPVRSTPLGWQSSNMAHKEYPSGHFDENCIPSLHSVPSSSEIPQQSHHPLSSPGLGEESASKDSIYIPDSGYSSLGIPKGGNEETNNPKLPLVEVEDREELEEDLFATWVDNGYNWDMPSFALLPSSIDLTDDSPSRLRRNNVFDRVSSPIRLYEQK
ncbi:hypothetical protein AOQ84DRAFT_367107 [Glonium stellatum]|uniref:C2H2-type domain-containing protein n=1 Tax=Glonium stellatum TaxID=574774 RepID=A0A8E2EUG7_9PEZI|nr:hypothetical protein AOQ84DRAFT_367107 [Glonium stellatum]